MNQVRLLALALLVIPVLAFAFPAAVSAQDPAAALIRSDYVIRSIDGSDVTRGPLMAGGTYTITLNVSISEGQEDRTFGLTTPLTKTGDRFWELKTEDYEGVDTDTWQPGHSTITFNGVKGTATFVLTGTVPSGYTSEQIPKTDDYLHFTKSIALVTLVLGQDTLLDEITANVKDQAIVAYEQLLTSKEHLLQTSVVEPKYAGLAQDVIKVAKDLSARGHVASARELLGTLPDSSGGFPVSGDQVTFTPYIIAIAAAAVLAVVFILLFLRSRAAGSLVRQQVDEEAGKLDVISVRMAKIDKQLSRDLEQVKEQLERISGR